MLFEPVQDYIAAKNKLVYYMMYVLYDGVLFISFFPYSICFWKASQKQHGHCKPAF